MQTTSYELSKKLDKKISIASDFKKSYFFWVISPEFDGEAKLLPKTNIKSLMELGCKLTLYPAYTLDEILEMLPKQIPSRHPDYIDELELEVMEDKYWWSYDSSPDYEHTNPAEAAGQLLVWCIENGHIKL